MLKAILVLAISAAFAMPANPIHKLENGFVERSMSIIVRDERAFGEYSIGLNDVTMKQLIQTWSNGAETTQPKAQSTTPTPAKNGEETKDSGEQAAIDQDATNAKKADTIQPETPSEHANSKKDFKDPTQSGPVSVNSSTQQSGQDDVHWLDPAAFENFKTLAKSRLEKGLSIQCDGKQIELESIKIGPPPRHPFYLVLRFEFDIPAARQTTDVEILDKLFRAQTGALRYSLKSKGRAMVLRSNVAPTVIRAKRVELSTLDEAEIAQQSRISARIGFVPKKPEKN